MLAQGGRRGTTTYFFKRCLLRQVEGRVSRRDGVLGKAGTGGVDLVEADDAVALLELGDIFAHDFYVAGDIIAAGVVLVEVRGGLPVLGVEAWSC